MVLEKQNSAFIDETLQLLSNENENQNGKQAEAASDLFSDDEDEMMKPQNEGLAALGIHAEMQREKGLAIKSLNDKVVQQELLEKHGSAPIVLTSKTAQEQLDDYRMENDVKITAS